MLYEVITPVTPEVAGSSPVSPASIMGDPNAGSPFVFVQWVDSPAVGSLISNVQILSLLKEFHFMKIFVITSYSIHYTKLYEGSTTMSPTL